MPNSTMLRQLNDSLDAIAGCARNGIVRISTPEQSHGTGIVIRADGLILTNAHVVKLRYPHVQLPDGRRLRAHALGWDKDLDLAALSVEATGLVHLHLGDSRRLKPGDLVLATGHPWGITGAATFGVVHHLGPYYVQDRYEQRTWLVCDAHLRPGHSGGPILDSSGAVVGVNTMLAGPDLGIAVPSYVVRGFLAGIGIGTPNTETEAPTY